MSSQTRPTDNALSTDEALRLATAKLTAKRIGNGDDLDRWYPYYAGYSHHFASEVLRELCPKPCTVLDPWNGSGTTTAAALHGGHNPVGFDLNPATLVVANAKLVHRAGLDRLPKLLDGCLKTARMAVKSQPLLTEADPLLRWLPRRAATFSRHALNCLLSQARCLGAATLPPPHALAALCILRAARAFAVEPGSNLSWSMPAGSHDRVRVDTLESLAWKTADEFAKDRAILPRDVCAAQARLGDARFLPLRARSVDVILTSPPYCTRIDYAKQTGFELAALLGISDSASRQLRHQLMGTTTLRKPFGEPRTARELVKLPPSIRTLLASIQAHNSHRSAEYYYFNFRQYFEDAYLAVGQIARVLRANGRAVLVLQNSYYKELPIPLSDLFCDLGQAHGLNSRVLVRKEVTRSMTSVNTRAKRYRQIRNYTEDLVLMERKA